MLQCARCHQWFHEGEHDYYKKKLIECREYYLNRVRTGPGNPGKSSNFRKSFSRPGKSWNSDAGPGKSWKSELQGLIYLTH